MFGLEGSIALVYGLCLLSTLLCVVYGAINWNKGDEDITPEDVTWAKEEDAIDEEF